MEPWWIALIESLVIVNLVMAAFAYTTWLERKLLGRLQNRYGPNRAGPFGLLQPIADLIKLVRKESFFPSAAIEVPYIAAPALAVFTALAAFAVIPFGEGWTIAGYQVNGVVADVPIGLILIFALGSVGVYGATWRTKKATRGKHVLRVVLTDRKGRRAQARRVVRVCRR